MWPAYHEGVVEGRANRVRGTKVVEACEEEAVVVAPTDGSEVVVSEVV